eukprot:263255-Amphidinium_carterae.2
MPPKKPAGALDAAWTVLQKGAKKQRVTKDTSIAEQVRHALADSCSWASPRTGDRWHSIGGGLDSSHSTGDIAQRQTEESERGTHCL